MKQIIDLNLTFLTYLNQSISLISEICFRKQITDTSQTFLPINSFLTFANFSNQTCHKQGQVLISCYQTIKPHLHRNQFKILTFLNFYLSLITSNISYVFHLLKEITPPSILAFFELRAPGYDFFCDSFQL